MNYMETESERLDNRVLDTIFARSAIRAYTDEALTDDEIAILADAALAAPTAMDKREQRFYFVTSKSVIDVWEKAVFDEVMKSDNEQFKQRMISRKGKVFYDAPLFVAIGIDKRNTYSMCDAGIAVQTLALCAKSMGLDSVILGLPALAFSSESAESIRESIGMDAEYTFGIGIAIGHAAMDKAPHDTDSSHVIYVK